MTLNKEVEDESRVLSIANKVQDNRVNFECSGDSSPVQTSDEVTDGQEVTKRG